MKQQLNLKQQQTLSPVLYQAMNLLTLDLMDLNLAIEKKVEENPALDWRDKYFYDSSKSELLLEDSLLENIVDQNKSLSEHLLEQLSWQTVSNKVYSLASNIINNLDERGFFKISLKESNFKQDSKDFKEALALVQNFEPVGCGVEDSFESLAVQLKAEEIFPAYSVAVLKEAFVLESKHKTKELEKLLNLDSIEVADFFNYIKTLALYPGLAFASSSEKFIYPELKLEYKEGSFKLSFIKNIEASLEINTFFKNLADGTSNNSSSSTDTKAISYAKKAVADANFFIKLLNQRQQTIFLVSLAIIKHQKEFLLKETLYPKALTLKQIASETNLHEATISRTVNSKYFEFNGKLIALKSLFSSSVSNSSGEEVSKDEIKDKIRDLITNSPKKLSDQKISDILNKMGYNIARRTVAKYRNSI